MTMLERTSGPIKAGILILLSAALAACTQAAPPDNTTGVTGTALTLAEPSFRFLRIEEAGAGADDGEYSNIMSARVEFHPQALAAVGTPVGARVVALHVRPGEAVKAGASLVTLQSAEAAQARATLAQAEAQAALAENLLQRQNEMLKKGVGLEVERLAAETAAKEARAELARARHMVALLGKGNGDRFTLLAPVSGTVLTVRTHVGAVVSPDADALIEVGDRSRLMVVAHVAESEVGTVAPGHSAQVRVPGLDAQRTATVVHVGSVVHGEQLRVPVYLSLDEPVAGLLPGMLAEARLRRIDNGALRLPTTAVLIKSGGERIVYVQREDGAFESRPVRTGRSGRGHVTVFEGVNRGDRVVVQGALLLDGAAEQLL